MTDNPKRCCDLVMKGGITSGVVYPKVVEQVAERFHLVGIAGTSAGAIAASLAAAAEYRRRTTSGFKGFDDLASLGEELAQEDMLLHLFTPDRGTRKLFKLARNVMDRGLTTGLKVKLGWKALRLEKTLRPLRDNYFGLCTGMANGNRGGGAEPLTEWLARRIDAVAGKPSGEPLTFRDLHEAPVPEAQTALSSTGTPQRSIDFRAVSTCLSFGRPYELPFDTNIFAFDPDEWRDLFPAYVVDFLVHKAREISSSTLARDGKLPLHVEDMPVVVGTRMSLSFPVLLSMIPLWTVDFRSREKELERVWFSDGGITSNFPMHRFDTIYPQWPTLGVTLAYTGRSGEPDRPSLRRDDVPEEQRLIYLPQGPGYNRLDRWNRFAGKDSAVKDLMGFGGAIFRSAQTWHDEAFLRLPGFRDRSAEVWMLPHEGGLKLSMGSDVVEDLTERGRVAGRLIAERFSQDRPGEAMSWDGHRWTRFRAGMQALVRELLELRRSIQARPMAGGVKLEAWLDGSAVPPTHAYGDNVGQRKADQQALGELLAWLDELVKREITPFQDGPRPVLDYGTRAPL